jgi:hypothetical protein
MTKEKRFALLESAQHWLNNYDLIDRDIKEGIDYTIDSCECCRLWFNSGFCDGCPIKSHTGVSSCGRTPYLKARVAIDSWILGYGSRLDALEKVGREYTFLVELAFR